MRRVLIVGVDEAGRGPLAGPVAVAAVVFRGRLPSSLRLVRDSKKLSVKQREKVFARLCQLEKAGRTVFACSFSGPIIIDRRGIVPAVRLALARAVKRLGIPPASCKVLLDGSLRAPAKYHRQKTVIRGDETVPIIALASVIAKVKRDQKMIRLAGRYPEYEFSRHKGYGTKLHYQLIKRFGVSAVHRRTFLSNL